MNINQQDTQNQTLFFLDALHVSDCISPSSGAILYELYIAFGICRYAVGSKSFLPDQHFKVTEIKQLCYFSTQSPFISTYFSTDKLTSPQMALYIPHSILHLARLLYVRPETFGPCYVLSANQPETALTQNNRYLAVREVISAAFNDGKNAM